MIHLIKDNLSIVLEDANRRFKTLKTAVEYSTISTKLKSELISNILEAAFSSVISEVEAPLSDSMPDLMVNGVPLEIKTSKTTCVWRGGEFSKRESDYLMVSYDDSGEDMKWFILYTYLYERDWKSSGSGNYYATTIDLNDILQLGGYHILIGDVEKKRTKKHLICK